jgi:hypothetical protein
MHRLPRGDEFTPHYRGAHAASRSKTGFRRSSSDARIPHNATFDSVSESRVNALAGLVSPNGGSSS